MDLKDFISVSGLSGIYKIVGQRSNGLIIQGLDGGKSKFVSARKHSFMPLESIGIFTYSDTAELKDIFTTMKEQSKDNPPPDVASSSSLEISEYFESILPEYDDDRVKINDMKKVIKWFQFLDEKGYISGLENEEE